MPPARLQPTDPRWVLALRTREALEGATLAADRREPLLRMAELFGLNRFEASLVIAIVQDRARRGESLDGAEATLAMVPLTGRGGRRGHGAGPLGSRWARAALWVGLCLATEAAIIALVFAG